MRARYENTGVGKRKGNLDLALAPGDLEWE